MPMFNFGGQAQVPQQAQPQGGGFLQQLLAPENAMPIAAALMGQQGNGQNFSNAMSAYGQTAAQTAGKNRTLDFFRKNAPEYADMVQAGMPINEAWQTYTRQRYAKQAANPFSDRAAAAQQYGLDPNSPEGRNFILSGDLSKGGNDFADRQQAAQQFGLQPDDPAYRSYVLTGKMPREDQAPLTATDKKAILEADEMVAANENAIAALDQAEKLSDNANSGWLAGGRASVGNNMPDWMVPDFISSPESSAATADMDNAVIGQALTSLRTIFGGNPTEGERKILLDLQGSSSMPVNVRKQVFARAREMAKRRLEFNRQRADSLRGGDYYKAGQGITPQQTGNRTQSGVTWTVEP